MCCDKWPYHLRSCTNLSNEASPLGSHRLNLYGLGLSLVMKYAVDEINANQILLPGVKLGYEIYDTCRQSAVIVKPTIAFLSAKSTTALSVECNYTNYEPSISAVIGPFSSEMVSIIGKVLGFFLLPQVWLQICVSTLLSFKNFTTFQFVIHCCQMFTCFVWNTQKTTVYFQCKLYRNFSKGTGCQQEWQLKSAYLLNSTKLLILIYISPLNMPDLKKKKKSKSMNYSVRNQQRYWKTTHLKISVVKYLYAQNHCITPLLPD